MDDKLVLEVLSFLLTRISIFSSLENNVEVENRSQKLKEKVNDEIVDMKQREDFENSH